MSMNILNEFLIHFHTFRNVDLINQGLYQIRAKIYCTENNKKLFALPNFHTDSKETESILQTDEQSIKPHNIISSYIVETNFEYVTKTFLIRYSDEEVEIDEFCYFRIEIPYSKQIKNDLMYNIEFELFFSDALMSLSKDKKGNQGMLSNVEFKSVSQQVLIINSGGLNQGYVESFAPVVYSDSFSSVLNCSVHMVSLDYKMRMNNMTPYMLEEGQITNIDKSERNEKTDKSENLTNTKINNQNNLNSVSDHQKISDKAPNTLIQFLLDDKDCLYKLEPKVVDELYEKYVISLLKNFSNLKEKYLKLMNRLFDEKMKSEYPFFVILQPLSVYFDERDKEIISIPNEEALHFSFLQKLLGGLSNRISDFTSEYISSRIILEINYIGSQIYQLWHKYIELIRYFPSQTNYILQNDYFLRYREDLSRFMKKATISVTDSTNLLLPVENNLSEVNLAIAEEMRKSLNENFLRPGIENMTNHIKPCNFPILFEEYYVKQILNMDTKKSFYENAGPNLNAGSNENLDQSLDEGCFTKNPQLCLHLVVLVHGFQGNSHDMRMVKNTISLINPSCVFLSSCANQDDTECEFEEMGKKLSNEVKSFIKEWNDGIIFKKISFIGHSIGGLIIRAALPHLSEHAEKMWMYISLSSPHLGYIYSSSKLVNAGMWLLKTWKKSKSLEQLCFSDAKEFKDCCIYKLSDAEGLSWFNYVYLISSHQDLYAPYDSTRIQLCSKALDDNQ